MKPAAAAWMVVALLGAGCATVGTHGPLGPQDEPIVLAHGLSGFRTFSSVSYFNHVPEDLRDRGYRVFVTAVPPWGSVQDRAQQLARQIESVLRRSGAPKVHIIAHSMGGLDARYVISMMGLGDRVATLTTVGTPHRGSPIADGYHALSLPPLVSLQDFGADFWVWTLGGLKVHNDTGTMVQDLSVRVAKTFNDTVKNHPRVVYYSFAGRTLLHDGRGVCEDGVWPNPAERDLAPPALLAGAVFLSGPNPAQPLANDGLVPVTSAKWGTFMGCIPADHMKEVGHPMLITGFPGRWSHRDFYVRWAAELVSGHAGLK